MGQDRIEVNCPIVSLNDSNDIYMIVDLIILTSDVNLNKVRFTPDFIEYVVENQEFYLGTPVVAETDKLESKKYNNLTHAFDGSFHTEQIGSFLSFSSKEEDGVTYLLGKARIEKRYVQTCEAIKELYASGDLKFSCEVFVGKYIDRDGYQDIPRDENNELIGVCVVSRPAETRATAYALVAEALNCDLGGKIMKKTYKDFFKDTVVSMELAELDLGQLEKKVFNKLSEQMGEDLWDYYATDFLMSGIILQHYKTGDYYKVDYKVEGDDITLGELYKVSKVYLPIEKDIEVIETKIEELSQGIEKRDKIIESLNEDIKTKDEIILEKDTNIASIGETLKDKEKIINELQEYKDKYLEKEKIEIQEQKKAQKEALKEKISKFFSEEEMETDEIKKAINEINEVKVNSLIADRVVKMSEQEEQKKHKNKHLLSSRITDEITVGNSDLISRYLS